jgi:hypothetical protein
MRELEFRKKKWTQELQLPLSSHSSPHTRTTEDIALAEDWSINRYTAELKPAKIRSVA